MEKRELYDKFEELSQNLMSMLAEVEAIKANFSGIFRGKYGSQVGERQVT